MAHMSRQSDGQGRATESKEGKERAGRSCGRTLRGMPRKKPRAEPPPAEDSRHMGAGALRRPAGESAACAGPATDSTAGGRMEQRCGCVCESGWCA